MKPRQCTRTGCSTRAIATLTYAYADSTAVVGPLALRAEPGSYDLCEEHAGTLSPPRGWELIRLPLDPDPTGHDTDDLLALADAVRDVGFTWDAPEPAVMPVPLGRRKGHLVVVADPAERTR